jgi:hypothetical protein
MYPRYEMHQLVDVLVAGSIAQRQRRRVAAARRRVGHLSGARAAVTRMRTILDIRSFADGPD